MNDLIEFKKAIQKAADNNISKDEMIDVIETYFALFGNFNEISKEAARFRMIEDARS